MRRQLAARQPKTPKTGLLRLRCHRIEQMVQGLSNSGIRLDHDSVRL